MFHTISRQPERNEGNTIRMNYIKTLWLREKMGLDGYYNPKSNTIVVDFSQGIFHAVSISYHEFTHKNFDVLGIEDWLDFFHALFHTYIKQGKIPPSKLFQTAEIIRFDKFGVPYRMMKVDGEWKRIPVDPWELM
jgi:hypothetical protein